LSTTTSSPPPLSSQTPLIDDASLADAEIDAFVVKAASRNLADMPALSAFQRLMDRYPQLSPDAQLELVSRVRAGATARDDLATTTSERQRRKLSRLVAEGERAKEYLAGSNFRLVLLICSEKARERYGVERAADVLPDLVGEANVALAEAIRDYDHARCPVFATYVARVVRDRVQFSLSKDTMVRLAPSWSRLKRIAAIRGPLLTTTLGREPTLDELREDLFQQCREWAYNRLTAAQQQLPADEREHLMLAKLRKQGMLGALASLSDVLVASQSMASLDAPVGTAEPGASTLGDFISEQSSDELLDGAELYDLRRALSEAMTDLDEREQTIIRLRYGLDGNGELPLSYAEIGVQFGVTAERIRQIERVVLDRLAMAPGQRDRLAAFLPSLEGVDLDHRDYHSARKAA
jgi:RNA polymerase nonessential primary-like sigma factor